jgi:hypothetical protein
MRHARSNRRVLGLAPSTRGVGFAVLDHGILSDWGVKTTKGNKNATALQKVERLFNHYEPSIIVLEDWSPESSRRAERIRLLSVGITFLAKQNGVKVKVLNRRKIRSAFFGDRAGTKYEIAQILADRYPRELRRRLPPKRKPWDSEHHQMDMFDAVTLVAVFETKWPRPEGEVSAL